MCVCLYGPYVDFAFHTQDYIFIDYIQERILTHLQVNSLKWFPAWKLKDLTACIYFILVAAKSVSVLNWEQQTVTDVKVCVNNHRSSMCIIFIAVNYCAY